MIDWLTVPGTSRLKNVIPINQSSIQPIYLRLVILRSYPNIILFIFLAIFSNIFSQKTQDSQIHTGLNASYNFDFEKAESIFQKIIDENPNHPAGYYFLSQIYLWKYLGGNDRGDKGIFIKYADLSIKKSEILIDKKETAEIYFYLGSAFQLKALALIYEGEFYDAYGDVKDAVDNLEECLELNPKFYDAYLGLGIFNYTLSYVPSFYRFLMGIFGLSSDKEKGFEQIKIAAEKGNFNKYISEFYKARLLSDYVADYNSSIRLTDNLLKQFPDNIVLHYQHGFSSLLNRDIETAEKSFAKIIEISGKEFQLTNSFAYLRMGDINFRKNNFNAAINYYEQFLNETRSFEFAGYAYYQIALCYSFLENEIEMRRNLIFARNGNLDIPDDYYAKEKSEYFYDKGFSKEYLKLIKAENLLVTKNYQSAEKIINEISSVKKISKETSAKCEFLKSQLLFSRNDFKAAIKNAEKIKEENLKIEKWILPAANLLIAESYFQLGNFEKAESFLQKAEEQNEFEYSEQFESKIMNLKRRLSNSKK
ncbi:MAG: hypothetical protein A2068_01835 [Ignavibacteria bacterium GWB2_35_6b]|nr:MAG: hypothetical protein A2068_01835 [Ignavibacteria bacterium GWB2_35_6b]